VIYLNNNNLKNKNILFIHPFVLKRISYFSLLIIIIIIIVHSLHIEFNVAQLKGIVVSIYFGYDFGFLLQVFTERVKHFEREFIGHCVDVLLPVF
jgi:hypothetical protein